MGHPQNRISQSRIFDQSLGRRPPCRASCRRTLTGEEEQANLVHTDSQRMHFGYPMPTASRAFALAIAEALELVRQLSASPEVE